MTDLLTEYDIDDPNEELTSKTGWRQFVNEAPNSPDLLPRTKWKTLTPSRREAYNDARMEHHAKLAIVATPTVNQVTKLGRRLTILNRGQLSARRGLVVTGGSGTGKSTALTQLGKHHEIQARRKRGDVAGPFLPVVYIIVPPASTAKMLAAEFARFLELPLPKSLNQVAVTNAVCDVLRKTRTSLVLVDEIHRLGLETRNGAETSDQLKYLSDRIPATFVYAGIDVESEGLFSGSRGRQIAGRFTSIATHPFAYGTREQRDEWAALVVTLEQVLRLHDHDRGELLRHAEYLYQRTSGMIGSLSHLIREAAILAIQEGTERITLDLLDSITVDVAAEQQRPPQRRRQRSRKNARRETA